MRIVIVLLVLAAVSPARADSETQAAMEEYFTGEKRGGLVLMGMGGAGFAVGGGLLAEGSARALGASYVLLGVGVAHAAAGVFVYFASRGRMDKFRDQILQDNAGFVTRESTRMRGVSTQFFVLKIVEVILIGGGLAMVAIGRTDDKPRLEGAGYALAAEMAATLVFDIFAARRASRYREQLGARVSVTDSGVVFGVGVTF